MLIIPYIHLINSEKREKRRASKGKPRISKRGNRHVRKAMHLPSLAAIRTDGRLSAIFERLASKHGIKMKAMVAILRKLLELSYLIWKSKIHYNPDFYIQNTRINLFSKQTILKIIFIWFNLSDFNSKPHS